MTNPHTPGPIGSPFSAGRHGPNPAGPPAGVNHDYRYGEVTTSSPTTLRRQEVSPLRAPWPLLIAGALVVFSCVIMVYWLSDQWISDPSAREFTAGTSMIILGVALGPALTVLMLRTHRVGRLGLTAWGVVALLSLIGELWPVGIAALVALVLMWLPASSKWIF